MKRIIVDCFVCGGPAFNLARRALQVCTTCCELMGKAFASRPSNDNRRGHESSVVVDLSRRLRRN